MRDYDSWLERPYQEACAQQDRDDEAIEAHYEWAKNKVEEDDYYLDESEEKKEARIEELCIERAREIEDENAEERRIRRYEARYD